MGPTKRIQASHTKRRRPPEHSSRSPHTPNRSKRPPLVPNQAIDQLIETRGRAGGLGLGRACRSIGMRTQMVIGCVGDALLACLGTEEETCPAHGLMGRLTCGIFVDGSGKIDQCLEELWGRSKVLPACLSRAQGTTRRRTLTPVSARDAIDQSDAEASVGPSMQGQPPFETDIEPRPTPSID